MRNQLGNPVARDDDVLVHLADLHRRDGCADRLASRPEALGLAGLGGPLQLRSAGAGDRGARSLGVGADGGRVALEFDDEQCRAVATDIAATRLAYRGESAGVKEFECGRDDAGLADLGNRRRRPLHPGERRGERRTRLGGGDQPEQHLGDDPERSLGADEEREQAGCRGVAALAEANDPPVGEHCRDARDEIGGDAVAEGVRAGSVAGDVAADGAGGRRARIGRVVQACRGSVGVDFAGDGARLRMEAQRLGFEAEDPVEAGEAEDDAALRRRSTGRVPGARAAGHDRDPVDGADADHAGDLLGRCREHDGIRKMALAGRTPRVVRVSGEIGGARVDVGGSDLTLEIANHAAIEHARRIVESASIRAHRLLPEPAARGASGGVE